MRSKSLAVLIAAAFVFGMATPAAADEGARVFKGSTECDVDVEGLGGEFLLAPCEVTNIARPDGGFSLIIRAQHPDYPFDVGTKVETRCLANFLFWVADGLPEGGAVFVDDAVRHFSATGHMTEVCHFRP